MKDTKVIKQLLKEFIKEYSSRAGSHPEEAYHDELLDDPAYSTDSVYVPHDIKKKIGKWARDMGLSTTKKKNR
jgi:hypothetical protein